ncbi:MAG: Zn-dependent alcohol dehydrogenase [Chloroflexota bacterium]
MRAAVCREFGKPLTIEEVEIDDPNAGEVKVKVSACAICHSDITYADGGWGGVLPAVYGHEAAGVVEQVGPGVTSLAVGDPVIITLIRSCGTCFYCIQGNPTMCETSFPLDAQSPLRDATGAPIIHGLRTAAFAEYVVVHESQLMAIPNDLSFETASLLACGVITGLCAVTNTAQIPAKSSVVVIGTGGVGLNSIQGAALSGAYPLIAVDLNDDKLEAAHEFGATHTLNPTKVDAVEETKRLTEGRGVDYVFVTVGSAAVMSNALSYLNRGGSMVIVGLPPTGHKSEIEFSEMASESQKILGSKMGSVRLKVDIPKLVALYQAGQLKLDELITRTYPLEEINEAIKAVKNGDALRNVIVF